MTTTEAGSLVGCPDPPEVGKVTHHSIELTWHPPPSQIEWGRLSYCVQEEESSNSKGFRNVYKGYATNIVVTGLKVLTQYRYRVRAVGDSGPGGWSTTITVTTAKQPQSCENLHKAVQRGDVETVHGILEEFPHYIDSPSIIGLSPLMSACRLGKEDVVATLLDSGADVEFKNSSGKTSLMEACYHGNLECVKMVIDRGGSWLTRDHSGFSALHHAVDGGHINVVTYTLSEGVSVDDVSDSTLSGWTPLLRLAAFGGNAEVAGILIQHGADVNRKDKDGKTPLMLAAVNGYKELVRVLLEHGAEPMTKNEYGKSAVDFAESFQRQGVLHIFEEHIHK